MLDHLFGGTSVTTATTGDHNMNSGLHNNQGVDGSANDPLTMTKVKMDWILKDIPFFQTA